MLLQEFNKIIEIDDHINKMHQELIKLYGERSALIKASEPLSNTSKGIAWAKVASVQGWAEAEYQKLAKRWQENKGKIPSFNKLVQKLTLSPGDRDKLKEKM